MGVEAGEGVEEDLEEGDVDLVHECGAVVLDDVEDGVEHVLLEESSQEVVV